MVEKYYKKVVCISNSRKISRANDEGDKEDLDTSYIVPVYDVTVGKIYQVTERDILLPIKNESDHIYYRIIDDGGKNFFYDSRQFKDLSEVRNEKLNQIINT